MTRLSRDFYLGDTVTQTLTKEQNGLDLTLSDELFVLSSPSDLGIKTEKTDFTICCGKRIGIEYAEEEVDFLWRFRIK